MTTCDPKQVQSSQRYKLFSLPRAKHGSLDTTAQTCALSFARNIRNKNGPFCTTTRTLGRVWRVHFLLFLSFLSLVITRSRSNWSIFPELSRFDPPERKLLLHPFDERVAQWVPISSSNNSTYRVTTMGQKSAGWLKKIAIKTSGQQSNVAWFFIGLPRVVGEGERKFNCVCERAAI